MGRPTVAPLSPYDACLRRPPSPILAFAALIAGSLLLLLVFGGLYTSLVVGGTVLVLATLGLLRGLWPAWAFLTAVGLAGLVHAFATGPKWWSAVALNGAMVILLLAPSTRRHVRRGRPRAAGWP
jgi:hypothetical protein